MTKQKEIIKILATSKGLNRFEAEQAGDHTLPSTVAVLRQKGFNIIDRWETVPTRFGRLARVKRYWRISDSDEGKKHEFN